MPFSLFHRSPVSDGTANRDVATPKNCRRRPLFTLFRTTIWKSWSRPTLARVTCPLWSPAKRVSTIQRSCPKCSPTLPNDWSAAAKWSELCVRSVKVRAVVTRRNCLRNLCLHIPSVFGFEAQTTITYELSALSIWYQDLHLLWSSWQTMALLGWMPWKSAAEHPSHLFGVRDGRLRAHSSKVAYKC